MGRKKKNRHSKQIAKLNLATAILAAIAAMIKLLIIIAEWLE